MKRSKESRQRMKDVQTKRAVELRAERGYVRTPEARAKQSATTKGRKWSDAQRSCNRSKPTAKPVVATLKKTGEIVGEYSSISEAGRALQCDATAIWKICEGKHGSAARNGKTYPIKSHHGYVFAYL